MTSPQQLRPDRYAGRRLPRWAVVVVTIVLVLLVALLAVVGLFVWAFSGGWDGLRGQAQPDDRAVVAARRDARGALDQVTTGVRSAVAAGVGASELARVRFDQCHEGQNNWKIHDGYTLRCELTDSLVLQPADADVTTVAGRLDAAFVAQGWALAGVRNEMTQDAGNGAAYLLTTRSGRYYRPGDPPQELAVTVTVRSSPLGAAGLPYDPSVPVEGDVDAYRRAVQGPDPAASGRPGRAPAPRVVVQTSVRYFDDD